MVAWQEDLLLAETFNDVRSLARHVRVYIDTRTVPELPRGDTVDVWLLVADLRFDPSRAAQVHPAMLAALRLLAAEGALVEVEPERFARVGHFTIWTEMASTRAVATTSRVAHGGER